MLKRDKNSICRGCGTSYPRRTGLPGKYCTNLCKVRFPKKKKKCKPECSPSDLYFQEVTYKNGDKHTRQVCKVCIYYKYVPRNTNQFESNTLGFRERSKELEKIYDSSFYTSVAWLRLRYDVFVKYGRKCALCRSTDGVMHVDHIKPRSKYPELELDINNLQVLCEDCNLGKSNKDETDWRGIKE